MPDRLSPFVASTVGPPEFQRYVIKRNYFLPPDFYTGSDGDAWTEDLGEARLYAHVEDLGRDLHRVARRELAHMPQIAYRLEVEVLAIGEATPEQVGEFVRDALTIGLDYEGHGPGPGLGTLVLVKSDPGSLRPIEADPQNSRPN